MPANTTSKHTCMNYTSHAHTIRWSWTLSPHKWKTKCTLQSVDATMCDLNLLASMLKVFCPAVCFAAFLSGFNMSLRKTNRIHLRSPLHSALMTILQKVSDQVYSRRWHCQATDKGRCHIVESVVKFLDVGTWSTKLCMLGWPCAWLWSYVPVHASSSWKQC